MTDTSQGVTARSLATSGYEDRVVIFIDLMGFEKFTIDELSSDPTKILDFYKYLSGMASDGNVEIHDTQHATVQGFQTSFSSVAWSPSFSFFSDTIIISVPANLPTPPSSLQLPSSNDSTLYIHAASEAAKIQLAALNYGLLTRGAITCGKIYHHNSKSTIFGPALIEAASLEKKVAFYPRVIASKEFQQKYIEPLYAPELEKFSPQTRFLKDADGFHFVNFLTDLTSDVKFHEKLDQIEKIMSIRENIIRNLTDKKDPHIHQKWQWFAKYFNYIFTRDNVYIKGEAKRDALKKHIQKIDV